MYFTRMDATGTETAGESSVQNGLTEEHERFVLISSSCGTGIDCLLETGACVSVFFFQGR